MNNRPIGIYDSGVGAVAVMRTIQNFLPNEKFILFADFKNAPYGVKTKEEISTLAKSGVKRLVDMGVKAVVVACNTATSAAIIQLRQEFDIPIIGMEPAIKPAAENGDGTTTIVLATSATLKLMKFQKLFESIGDENIFPVSCPGLSTLIEQEKQGSPKIIKYLEDVLSDYIQQEISSIVIGCTHYSFIEEDIKKATGCKNVFDGRYGTARHLKKTLQSQNLLGQETSSIEFVNDSTDEKYHELLLDFMDRALSFED